jgi:hypothetical protein
MMGGDASKDKHPVVVRPRDLEPDCGFRWLL